MVGDIDGEDDLIGAGVHFCATCDGPFYRGAEHLVVIGGGNSGLEEGLFLTQFADEVVVLEYAEELQASRLLQDKVRAHPGMSVHTGVATTMLGADADGGLAAVHFADRVSGEEQIIEAEGAFVFIGLDPNTWRWRSARVPRLPSRSGTTSTASAPEPRKPGHHRSDRGRMAP